MKNLAGVELALSLLYQTGMSTALELVYQYRQLAGKCEQSGLSMEEIHVMNAIESIFADRSSAKAKRQFGREPVSLTATLRGRKGADAVSIDNLAPGGLVCVRAPYFDEGETVEVVIDDAQCNLSYRFKAIVTWLDDDVEGDYILGLQFVGTPVLLRFGPNGQMIEVAHAA